MSQIKTYPEMNETIKDLLSRSDEPMQLYILARIEELEKQVSDLTPLPNVPLTMEQLREMDGEPVWVERNGCDPIWALVHVWDKPTNIIFLAGHTGGVLNLKVELDCGGKIYRRKPEDWTS